MSELYEFDADKYLRASRHQKEWGHKLISEFHFTVDESILDLGCGDGILTKIIADKVPNGYVLGIDVSEGMLNKANELKQKNLRFQRLDINDIDFENEFDIIICNATLHWV